MFRFATVVSLCPLLLASYLKVVQEGGECLLSRQWYPWKPPTAGFSGDEVCVNSFLPYEHPHSVQCTKNATSSTGFRCQRPVPNSKTPIMCHEECLNRVGSFCLLSGYCMSDVLNVPIGKPCTSGASCVPGSLCVRDSNDSAIEHAPDPSRPPLRDPASVSRLPFALSLSSSPPTPSHSLSFGKCLPLFSVANGHAPPGGDPLFCELSAPLNPRSGVCDSTYDGLKCADDSACPQPWMTCEMVREPREFQSSGDGGDEGVRLEGKEEERRRCVVSVTVREPHRRANRGVENGEVEGWAVGQQNRLVQSRATTADGSTFQHRSVVSIGEDNLKLGSVDALHRGRGGAVLDGGQALRSGVAAAAGTTPTPTPTAAGGDTSFYAPCLPLMGAVQSLQSSQGGVSGVLAVHMWLQTLCCLERISPKVRLRDHELRDFFSSANDFCRPYETAKLSPVQPAQLIGATDVILTVMLISVGVVGAVSLTVIFTAPCIGLRSGGFSSECFTSTDTVLSGAAGLGFGGPGGPPHGGVGASPFVSGYGSVSSSTGMGRTDGRPRAPSSRPLIGRASADADGGVGGSVSRSLGGVPVVHRVDSGREGSPSRRGRGLGRVGRLLPGGGGGGVSYGTSGGRSMETTTGGGGGRLPAFMVPSKRGAGSHHEAHGGTG